jgi:hypothetical protein
MLFNVSFKPIANVVPFILSDKLSENIKAPKSNDFDAQIY